jgi:hypothetical protein
MAFAHPIFERELMLLLARVLRRPSGSLMNDDDLNRALDRLSELEAETAGATEQQLAASHKKILHDLRRDWLTTICKAVIIALTTMVASLAIVGKKSEKDKSEGEDRP